MTPDKVEEPEADEADEALKLTNAGGGRYVSRVGVGHG